LIGSLLAYEIAKTLTTRSTSVTTPLGVASESIIDSPPVLIGVLRAGLPLLHGFSHVFGSSDTMLIGAARQEGAAPDADGLMPIKFGYQALPTDTDRDWIYVDPMLATGSTLIGTHKRLLEQGLKPKRCIVAGVVGHSGAVDRLTQSIEGVEIWLAALDPDLDERGYIVPGLGDAGDLAFGPKR
jgi:uracil phosphoribosyltransferase